MGVRVLVGDALAVLKELPEKSVQSCITSPPYWGLRDYGLDPLIWGDGHGCEHEWGAYQPSAMKPYENQVPQTKWKTAPAVAEGQNAKAGQFCRLCGAWRGSLGLEPTPQLYVQHLVQVFREVRRVLRDDGVLWVNLGDSYAGSGAGGGGNRKGNEHGQHDAMAEIGRPKPADGLKPKDLVGIPWRVAFALQDDGWWLRSDIIWAKPNPMPESVTDRPTKAHEYIFLLAKSQRYYWDAEAVREAWKPESIDRAQYAYNRIGKGLNLPGGASHAKGVEHTTMITPNPAGRNLRTVWTISTMPFSGAHFATFPVKLVEPMVKASTSERGCCPKCGKPWERVVERAINPYPGSSHDHTRDAEQGNTQTHASGVPAGTIMAKRWYAKEADTTLGWRPGCACDAGEPVPCVVLDPFGGAGTTGLVASRLGRDAVLIELNPAYGQMTVNRLVGAAPLLSAVTLEDHDKAKQV